MEPIRDTPLEHAVLYWPIRPPRASMLVVVKATFALEDGAATLAETQEPVTGALHWEDDPERSARYPSEFALLKPRGECFVVGHCRPLTPRPVERTVASFRVGAVQKSMEVYGDRTWAGGRMSKPVPFDEMPLSWERAFGGPAHAANPAGRGIAEDANGLIWLPNVEAPGRTVVAPRDRPAPVCASPLGMTWPTRARHVGTYDARWKQNRAPWLAEDFKFEFFNEAPEDQQISGYWRGDERIELTHLHPTQPAVRATLPGLFARAFVERGEAFDEVPLVLDTLTVDADRGLLFAAWRGTVDLPTAELAPTGIDRLFVMHDRLAEPMSSAACRERMLARIAANQAELDAMAGVEPPPAEVARPTMEDVRLPPGAAAPSPEAPKEDVGEAALEKLKKDLTNAGVDVEGLLAQAEGEELAEPDMALTREHVLRLVEEAPVELPQELIDSLLTEPQPEPLEEVEPPEPPPQDLRSQVIELHRRKAPLRGDFSGVNLAGLDLRGLDARDAILLEANFRGANLTSAKLDGASLAGADFLSATMSRASLRDADLTGAVLEDAQLDGARLGGATFEQAELQEAKLDEAILDKADFRGANLEGASLRDARCAATTFDQARLQNAKLTGAQLPEARLYGTQAQEANFDGAKIEGIRVGRGADLSRASVRRAEGDDSHWRDANLDGVSFAGSALRRADFSRSTMTGARLDGTHLRRARFIDTKLTDSSLAGADMYEATFQGADLKGVTFRGASLFRADFYRASGERVDLEGANLEGTSWDRKKS